MCSWVRKRVILFADPVPLLAPLPLLFPVPWLEAAFLPLSPLAPLLLPTSFVLVLFLSQLLRIRLDVCLRLFLLFLPL